MEECKGAFPEAKETKKAVLDTNIPRLISFYQRPKIIVKQNTKLNKLLVDFEELKNQIID